MQTPACPGRACSDPAAQHSARPACNLELQVCASQVWFVCDPKDSRIAICTTSLHHAPQECVYDAILLLVWVRVVGPVFINEAWEHCGCAKPAVLIVLVAQACSRTPEISTYQQLDASVGLCVYIAHLLYLHHVHHLSYIASKPRIPILAEGPFGCWGSCVCDGALYCTCSSGYSRLGYMSCMCYLCIHLPTLLAGPCPSKGALPLWR